MIKGIDVYNASGTINWSQVFAAGYKFAMIKASEGHTLADASMARNLAGAAMAGLHTGVYHWIHAESVAEAVQEADFFLKLIRGCKMEYPVALDIEQATILRLSKDKLTDIVIAWCQRVQQAGYYVALYCAIIWYGPVSSSTISGWRNITPLLQRTILWQFGSTARVAECLV